jgi:hypothetical protein
MTNSRSEFYTIPCNNFAHVQNKNSQFGSVAEFKCLGHFKAYHRKRECENQEGNAC